MRLRTCLSILTACVLPGHARFDASTVAWYTSPATNFTTTLPIGNGRLGAAIWGTAIENVTLNEDSIWNGSFVNRVNPKSYGALAPVRSMLASGNITTAGEVTLEDMAGIPALPQSYSPLGALRLDFGHARSAIRNYTRSLDLRTGNAVVDYDYQGVTFRREYVASYPDDVIAIRLSTSKAGSLNVVCSLERALFVVEKTASATEGVGTLVLKANSIADQDGPIRFSSQARIMSNGGRIGTNGTSIVVRGASTVDIVFDAETSYRYESERNRDAELEQKLQSAVKSGFAVVKKNAVSDYAALSERVDLDLGSSGMTGRLPTDTRLLNYQHSPDSDPELATLMFHFGRHCLITSSRAKSSPGLPANLQGLWNQDYDPAWGGRFTLDINLEMNYWPAQVTNLAETFTPFIDLMDIIKPRGQDVARSMYHCDNEGYVLHHNTDLWGDAAPVDNGTTWTMWPMGGAWLSANLMEHYRFTQDETVLRERIWPLLQSAAQFYYCYLFPFEGYYSTGPSISPEAAFIVPDTMFKAGSAEGIDIAPTMDNSLLHELFQSVIETCNTLGITGSDLHTAKKYLAKIKPPQIGSAGRILEWRLDYQEQDPGHRHMSPIVGLYPGSQLAPLVNQTLAKAAKAFLDYRIDSGSGSTGWSRTWTMNLYARLFDGDAVWNHTQIYLKKFPSPNLWNTDSGPDTVFQIDGNFAFTSGIAEMLLQSHEVVHLLPALPSAVPAGSVSGLVARGNFMVDMQWSGGVLQQATITSRSGKPLAIRVQDGRQFLVDGGAYLGPIHTRKGEKYTITLSNSRR
ncbi:glycoside hydrolase family 95 protein [Aspergillus homomorphus CBS 101889]|uniref:Alpha-L-fucosidase 2 n=1 Tax=Aspergillus homomorphus (strain CBS 101889) TaxID=1450537 RepID=A0A395IAF3_ASPHC|nr:alpha-L-fucosidase 2 precursor [Aspergillus homomorphus CBS 101889]RAL16779.1 alpha-L-fucosidase 2 precursor [Aspergillus homomorphus CBS 101889]